jgi:hypothetical protein
MSACKNMRLCQLFTKWLTKSPVPHTTLTITTHEHCSWHFGDRFLLITITISDALTRWFCWFGGSGSFWVVFFNWPAFCPKKTALPQIITFFYERAVTPRHKFPLDIMERDLDLALFCINWKFNPPKSIRMWEKYLFSSSLKKKLEWVSN